MLVATVAVFQEDVADIAFTRLVSSFSDNGVEEALPLLDRAPLVCVYASNQPPQRP